MTTTTITTLLPELDNECSNCDGAGLIYDPDAEEHGLPEEGPCAECEGAGRELTEAGRQLLQFLERHLPKARR